MSSEFQFRAVFNFQTSVYQKVSIDIMLGITTVDVPTLVKISHFASGLMLTPHRALSAV